MATGKDSMETASPNEGPDFYKCGVCFENMSKRNPRLLVCHHSYCEICLKKLIKDHKIVCPNCRAKTVVRKDVTELAMNFWLLQMFDHDKQDKAEKTPSKMTHNCQICQKNKVVNKCETCSQILCKECSEKHEKIKKFKGHHLIEICDDHCEQVTQICMLCVKPACLKCLVMHHGEHEAQVEPYDSGCKKIRKKLKQQQDIVGAKMTLLLRAKEEDSSKLQETLMLKNSLEVKRAMYLKKVEEVTVVLSEVQTKYIAGYNETMHAYNQLNENGKQVSDMIQRIVGTDSGKNRTLITNYSAIKSSIDKRVGEIEKQELKRYETPPYEASPSFDTVIIPKDAKPKKVHKKKDITKEMQKEKRENFLISVADASESLRKIKEKDWKCPWCKRKFTSENAEITEQEYNDRNSHYKKCPDNIYV